MLLVRLHPLETRRAPNRLRARFHLAAAQHRNKSGASVKPEPGSFDLPGFVLAGSGLASIMYAISEGPFRGWGSPLIVGTALAGSALLAGMVVVELRTPEPMVDLRLFADRLLLAQHYNL